MRRFVKMICVAVCILAIGMLIGCTGSDEIEKLEKFFGDDEGGKYNAVVVDIEEGNKITYYMGERYGIWEKDGESRLVALEIRETPSTFAAVISPGIGDIEILLVDTKGYYVSGNLSEDRQIFLASSDVVYSEDGSMFTVEPYSWIINLLFEDGVLPETVIYDSQNPMGKEMPIKFTKVCLPEEELLTLEDMIERVNYVPEEYFEFISAESGSQFIMEQADLWVNSDTMTGVWTTNSTKIPIRMEFNEKVPYVEIYDTGKDAEEKIFAAYLTCTAGGLKVESVVVNKIFYELPDETFIGKVSDT